MLHILMNSPFVCDFEILLRTIRCQDELLLLSDGVIACVIGSVFYNKLMFLTVDVVIYVMKEDILARGLFGYLDKKIFLIDYIGFVKLTEKHASCMSW